MIVFQKSIFKDLDGLPLLIIPKLSAGIPSMVFTFTFALAFDNFLLGISTPNGIKEHDAGQSINGYLVQDMLQSKSGATN